VISQESQKRNARAGAPWLRHFGFEEEFASDDAQRRVLFKESRDMAHVSGKKSRVGIEENEYISASVFRRAIDGGTEAAVFGERDEREGELRLKDSERRIFTWVVIRHDALVWHGKFDVSKRRKTCGQICCASIIYDKEGKDRSRVVSSHISRNLERHLERKGRLCWHRK